MICKYIIALMKNLFLIKLNITDFKSFEIAQIGSEHNEKTKINRRIYKKCNMCLLILIIQQTDVIMAIRYRLKFDS